MKSVVSLFGLFVLALCAGNAHAQTWKTVNDPYATRQVYQAYGQDSVLWLLDDGDKAVGVASQVLRVKKLQSGSWFAYPDYTPTGVDSIHGVDILPVGTDLYVTSAVFSGGQQSARLLRLNLSAQSWSEVSAVNTKMAAGSRFHAMSLYQNELYLGGELLNAQGENQILRYKLAFGIAEMVSTVKGVIYHQALYQNGLCFGGEFDSIGAEAIKNLSYYDNGVFFPYSGNGSIPGFLKTLANGDMVYFEITQSQQNNLTLLSSLNDEELNYNFPDNFFVKDMDRFHGEEYCIQTAPLEGIMAPGVYHLNRKTGRWEVTKSLLNPNRSILVNATDRLFLVELSGEAVHIQEINTARVTGRVFIDIDQNCVKTMGDRNFGQDILVHDKENELYFPAQEPNGNFGSFVNAGNYELEVSNLPLRLSDKVCNWNNSFSVGAGDSISIDIPLSVIDTSAAVRLELSAASGFRARQGFEEEYQLIIYNEGFRFQSCPVSVLLPEYITFAGADIMPDDSNGSLFTWHINIAPFQHQVIRFKGKVYVSAPAETKLAIVARSDSGCLRYDNRDSLKLRVVGAFDPNDKQSDPDGDLKLDTREIRYHIRFQNTGTDTAVNVSIIDTLDLNLPLRYLQYTGYSPFKPELYVDGPSAKLTFFFQDIMLPDSGTDLEGSSGYVSYKAVLSPNMKEGDSLKNTAYIYFDYQKAVITNTVVNKLVADPDRVIPVVGPDDKYLIYPNPANNELNIVNFTMENTACELYTMDGKLVRKWELAADSDTLFPVESLKPGIYFVRFPQWNARQTLVITSGQ